MLLELRVVTHFPLGEHVSPQECAWVAPRYELDGQPTCGPTVPPTNSLSLCGAPQGNWGNIARGDDPYPLPEARAPRR